ncbi:TPA: ATP-dependent Clp protease ATP-binding subunit ClpA [Neisseria meningitidis]|jgi:ATP-dependent clp protease ATP-binding subunit clpA|uniref:ATP-dependent Clp protease ATP-binding subunit ClpA n=1 Tax=Neisseria meningitidis TaxID=487 RepID=UPI000C31D70A|nr:ATP-dependent Clp protease ATP-binding subunit ClpA [Neisseria meningitidis]MBG8578155.1 ATP-dependent Clp protease ATP-binding subunit ClpA [Neisseria meningitidis]MBG8593183.1 ATP-dependent Clp protease ATP-binding subunit ClpA [Neisseria meningitidis]MBG8602263.1 ATP-dependent Clp protease ATP-binding subunit ClpA [Neisseria meningitidis]MBG8604425.1 ATP-dependent Clp protease ATP-binding subunit ClpA [Neisseria meningitidis]MBG8608809.1 ATP-dependent Clp protease ATP-binding subunit Clp
MLAPELEQILQQLYREARKAHYEFISLEHLLLVLIEEDASVPNVLKLCGADLKVVSEQLAASVAENTPLIPEHLLDTVETRPTLGFQRVMQRAMVHTQSAGKAAVEPLDVLVALMSETDSHTVYFLKLQSVTRFEVLRCIAHGSPDEDEDDGNYSSDGMDDDNENRTKPGKNPLSAYTVNLNTEVKAGRIDPLIGRKHEMERLVQILCRRRKNNPLLVGEAGVGKTALAEGLAHQIVNGGIPDALKDAEVYALDMGSLLAGTKYRGDFEARVKSVLKQLEKIPHAILFIDEIHTIIGAGSTSGGTMDASNLLKPALAKGSLRCIGATTYDEYRTIFDKDHALSRRFQKIDVVEPTVSETVQILRGLKPMFEAFHQVRYTQGALEAAAELSARYINERFLPDKAIDVMDEAGAAQRILPKSKQKKVIGKAQIETVIAKVSRIPEKTVSHDDKQVLQFLDRDLKNMVYGQENAIDALVAAVKMSRSGLALPDKPIGSFLFSGPTGVGKTEAAKQLAYSMGVPLQRFDMSEYMERHAVSRLIGAPPGYVGFEQGGLLTEAVNKQPHCVLLLDEIEKAHPDIFNVLLQVMDAGKLTDNNGKSADFRNVILIMTTNAGAESLSRPGLGFTAKRERGDEMQAINKLFTPEFRNRLDAIIPFAPLSEPIIAKVVDKFLLQLEHRLLDKKVEAEFTPALRKYLAEKGFDPQMGARPMHRLIQEKIRKPLADELLFGKLADGGFVRIGWDAEKEEAVLKFKKSKVKI